MSRENREVLERAVDAYDRRDVEALCAELDPDVEWHPALPGLPWRPRRPSTGGMSAAYPGSESSHSPSSDCSSSTERCRRPGAPDDWDRTAR